MIYRILSGRSNSSKYRELSENKTTRTSSDANSHKVHGRTYLQAQLSRLKP